MYGDLGANIALSTGAPRINPLAYTFGARSTFLAPPRTSIVSAPRIASPSPWATVTRQPTYTPRTVTPLTRTVATTRQTTAVKPVLMLKPAVPSMTQSLNTSSGGGGGGLPAAGDSGEPATSALSSLTKSPVLLIAVGLGALLLLNRR